MDGAGEKASRVELGRWNPSRCTKSTGKRRPTLARRNSRSNALFNERAHELDATCLDSLCARNDGCEASLERWRVYQAPSDRDAARHQQVRVVDESGEDYLSQPRSLYSSNSRAHYAERRWPSSKTQHCCKRMKEHGVRLIRSCITFSHTAPTVVKAARCSLGSQEIMIRRPTVIPHFGVSSTSSGLLPACSRL